MEALLAYETIIVAVIAASATIMAALINKSRKEHKETRQENKQDHLVVASIVRDVKDELTYLHEKIDHVDEQVDKVDDKIDKHIHWHMDRK